MSLGALWCCRNCGGSKNPFCRCTDAPETLPVELVHSANNALQPAIEAAAQAAQPLLAAAEPYVRPVVAAVAPYVRRLEPLTAHAVAIAAPHGRAAAQWANRQAGALEPWQLMLLTALATLLAARLLRRLRAAVATLQDKGEPAQSGFCSAPPMGLTRHTRDTCGHRQAAGVAPPAPLCPQHLSFRTCLLAAPLHPPCRPGPGAGGLCAGPTAGAGPCAAAAGQNRGPDPSRAAQEGGRGWVARRAPFHFAFALLARPRCTLSPSVL